MSFENMAGVMELQLREELAKLQVSTSTQLIYS